MKLRAKTVVPGKCRNLLRQGTSNRPLTKKRRVIKQNCTEHHPIGRPSEINKRIKKASRLTKNYQAIQKPLEDETKAKMNATPAIAISDSIVNHQNVEGRLSTRQATIFDRVQRPSIPVNIAKNLEMQSSSKTDSRPTIEDDNIKGSSPAVSELLRRDSNDNSEASSNTYSLRQNKDDNIKGSSTPAIPVLHQFDADDSNESSEIEIVWESKTASGHSRREVTSARRFEHELENTLFHQCRIILKAINRKIRFVMLNPDNNGDALLSLQNFKKVFIRFTQKMVSDNRNSKTRLAACLCCGNSIAEEVITID